MLTELPCKKGVLKNFAKVIGKGMCQNLFLIITKLQAQSATLLKRDSGTSISEEFCKSFKNIVFNRAPPEDCFCVYSSLADTHSAVGRKLFQLRLTTTYCVKESHQSETFGGVL